MRNDLSTFALTAPVVGVLVIGVLACSVNVIDEGEKSVVLTWGEISKTWEPGLHFKVPFVQSVKTYNMRVRKAVFGNSGSRNDLHPVLSAYSNDQQIIESYRLSITWAYNPAKIDEVYKNFGRSENDDIFYTVISPIVQQSTKAILGQYTALTIVQERAKLDKAIEMKLKDQLAQYPVNILSIQFEDVNFSQSYEAIIEKTAQKKQEIEAAKNELQRIEVESQQQVAQAEARNKAIKLQADADAYRITTQAKAEADALQLKGSALKQNAELIELTKAERWNGVLPTTQVNGTGSGLLLGVK